MRPVIKKTRKFANDKVNERIREHCDSREINEGKEEKTCCICGEKIVGWGNDPWGACVRTMDGQVRELTFGDDEVCCDDCNYAYVIPGRLYKMKKQKANESLYKRNKNIIKESFNAGDLEIALKKFLPDNIKVDVEYLYKNGNEFFIHYSNKDTELITFFNAIVDNDGIWVRKHQRNVSNEDYIKVRDFQDMVKWMDNNQRR